MLAENEPIHILLIDDNPDDRRLTMREIRKEIPEVQFEETGTAERFDAALKVSDWSLAITDYQLRWSDGLTVFSRLRERFPGLPVIMLTATGTEEVAVEAMKNGINDYVLKTPKHVKRIGVAIRRVLEYVELERNRKLEEEKYHHLLDNLRDGMILAKEGVIQQVNPAAAHMWGYASPDDMVELGVWHLVPPESKETVREWALRLAAGEDMKNFNEFRARRKDGSTFDCEVRITTAPGDSGLLTMAILRDISEHKRADEALRKSEAKYRELVQNANSIILRMDANGNVTFFNEFAQSFFGFAEDEILGRNVVGTIVPETDTSGRDLAATMEDIRHNPERYASNENENMCRNGERVWVSWTNKVISDEKGNVKEILCIGNDITGRKKAEEGLRESEERYRLHFENVGDVIYSTDREFRITSVSPSVEVFLGYCPEEITGRSIAELNVLSPEYLERALSNTMRVLEGEQSGPTEYEFIAKDGTEKFGEVVGTPLIKDGKVVEVISVARDITERKQLEEQLCQAQKMEAIGQLAGGVAHDFNNLLTAIIGHAQLAMNMAEENSPIYKDLQEVEKAGQAAANLTRQLLAFSRKQVIRPQVMDLNQDLEGMKKLLQRLIREDIDLQIKPGPEMSRIIADPGQVEQVIINLVVNARDAMPDGGRIILETADVELDEDYANAHQGVKPGWYAMLAVSDTGCGMSEEVRKNIFDPFFTTKPEGQGTGLGLSTVYGIAKQHGGNVWVYSEEGHGTTFKVYLPVAETGEESERFTEDKSMPRGSETILIVEDERVVRNVAVRILRNMGYTVLEASNGKQALELLKEEKAAPDLLLTDVIMPGMGGEKLAEEYRRRSPGAKIIFMSGYTDGAMQQNGLLMPGVELLEKPLTPQSLAQKVRKILDEAAPAE